MSAIKNAAITGASGNLGKIILDRLNASNKFNVTVFRRIGSSSAFPDNVTVVDIDLTSVDDLTAALKGQDAFISAVGTLQIPGQRALIDAAIAAGVKRFIPSDFGSNLDNPKTRKLPVFAKKIEIQEYLIEKAKADSITYSLVYNSAFLDWGLDHGFLLSHEDGKPKILDGGDRVFSATTLATIGDAVVGILSHPEETKNRAVYVDDAKITQNQLLKIAREATPNKTWEPIQLKVDDLTAQADARLAQGLFDAETFIPYLFRAIVDPAYGGNFEKTDNDLLGIKGLTEEQVAEIVKKVVQQ
ncbi:unnamed protein product [Clonostachys rhizophaga]|uniref:NmrA-like domain-containing protein n=1 Tax=Clonostachys rhizophaga TaxID=160324 RepID=A0A9N9YR28_9HYPO|nr:unnamed protein product [Clonostachys rhizophaga]